MWALAFWPEANFSESATNGGSDRNRSLHNIGSISGPGSLALQT